MRARPQPLGWWRGLPRRNVRLCKPTLLSPLRKVTELPFTRSSEVEMEPKLTQLPWETKEQDSSHLSPQELARQCPHSMTGRLGFHAQIHSPPGPPNKACIAKPTTPPPSPASSKQQQQIQPCLRGSDPVALGCFRTSKRSLVSKYCRHMAQTPSSSKNSEALQHEHCLTLNHPVANITAGAAWHPHGS